MFLIFKPCSETLVNADIYGFSFGGKITKFLEFRIIYNITGRNLFLTVPSFEELSPGVWVGGQNEHLFH